MSEPVIRNKIDVSQLREEPIPEGRFPATYPCADFRVWIAPEAHQRILAHAQTNTQVELCGVLIGQVQRDAFGPFAIVEDVIKGEHARNQGAQVTFTQDTWTHIFAEADQRHRGKQIIGWYHTHPGFGIFLSPMDMFIQENFFNLPWQVAFVVDPLAGKEGIFVWRNGKATPAMQYWVGDHLKIAGQPVASRRETEAPKHEEPEIPQAPAPHVRSIAWDIIQMVLLFLIVVMVSLLCITQRKEIRSLYNDIRAKVSSSASRNDSESAKPVPEPGK